MDRRTIYPGQVPLETDLLNAQQYAMTALAEFCSTVLGTPTLVDSFTVTPTTPATLDIVLTPGNIYQMEDLEQSPWSSLPSNLSTTIMKQGILLTAQTMAITPPNTFGYSQVYLMQVAYADIDTGALVLPYYNAANPSAPFSGPGNAGSANNTIRQGQVNFQLKAGTPAPTGTQVAPSADPGFVGIYTITVGQGATSITAGNIAQLPTAPFLATLGHLPQIPNGVQNWQWSYCNDTGTVNAMVGTVAPIPLALVPGLSVRVKVANTNTGAVTFNLNGLGVVSVTTTGGAALVAGNITANEIVDLVYNGSTWQLSTLGITTSSSITNNYNSINIPYCVDTGTVNNVVAPFSPVISSVSAGNIIEVKIAHTNTSASNITVNSLASVPIVDLFGNALVAGTIQAGEVALMIYNGTSWQLVNIVKSGSVNLQVITSSGTYTPTPGTVSAIVIATGGGASGSTIQSCGSGGGAGATAIALVPMTGVASVSCTIGAGGTGVNGHDVNGNNGGQTSFGSYAVAGGGQGGYMDNGNGDGIGGAGGTATAGLMQIAGGDGQSQGGGANINGNGGASFWGGGAVGSVSSQVGVAARAYGAGGGGADNDPNNNTSGAGYQGVILVLEF